MKNQSCVTHHADPKIVFEENGRKATFVNKARKKCTSVEIDGCLIKNGPRCDYMLNQLSVASVLIELKGTDIEHACLQLEATLKNATVIDMIEPKIGMVVICRRFPRFDSFVLRAKQKFAKQYKAGFHVYCDQRELDIARNASISG